MNSRTFRKAALCVALGACIGAMAPLAMAQSTTGAVAGRASAGDQITIVNKATGASRTVTVGSDGVYRVTQLPIGDYRLQLMRDGQPVRMNPTKPKGPNAVPRLRLKPESASVSRGKTLYLAKCASCHARNGEGRKENPPVWGPMSYNQGAGLSKTDQLAAWLKVAMPLEEPDLTEQEALDVAAYITSQDRPPFDLKKHLPRDEKLGEYNAEPRK